MKPNIIIPFLALALGLGVGFGVGRSGGDEAEAIVKAAEEAAKTRSASRPGADRANPDRAARARSLEEIYSRPGQSNRIQALLDLYGNLGPDEFQSEAEKLDNLPFNERLLASILLFGKWAEVDPQAAMAYTDTMGMAGGFVRPTVLQGWASVDPENAAKYYGENPGQFAMMGMMGGGRRGGGGSGAAIIAGEWAKQDPTAAMAWASGLTTEKGQAMSSVLSEVAKNDPAQAAKMAMGIDEADRGDALSSIARQWGSKNFAEAEAWVRTLPADQQGAAMAEAIAGLASTSPSLAAAEYAKLGDADAKREAAPVVARNMARDDARGAMDWVLGLDDEGAQRDSMREVMPILVAQDDAAARAVIASQSSARLKDAAAESYIWSNRSAQASSLLEVAGMIEDEGSRQRTTGMVAARWMREDRAAATQFIQSTDTISPEMKERLMGDGGGRGWRGR